MWGSVPGSPEFRETAVRLGAVLSSENPCLAAVNHPTVPVDDSVSAPSDCE